MHDNSNKKIQQVGVYGFIYTDKSQILLVRRALHDTNPNMWELPGGGLDHGEDPEVGVAREVLEETGLIVDVQFPLATRAKLSDNDTNKHTVRIAYLCKLLAREATVRLSREHSESLWINLGENYPLPVSGLFKQCLDTIKKYPQLIT